MSNETVNFSARQGGIHFNLGGIPKIVADRVGEIRRRYPQGTWDNRDSDLLQMAYREIREGKVLYSPELDRKAK